MSPSFIYHPLILWFAQFNISVAAAAFTTKDSPLRYAALIASSFIGCLAIANFHSYVHSTASPARSLAGAIFSFPLALFDRLIYRKWEYGKDYLGPVTASKEEREKQTRWDFGNDVFGMPRSVGSQHEIANVPHFDEKDPNYVPSRNIFLAQQVILMAVLYYLNSVCLDLQLGCSPSLLSAEHVPFFSRISDVSAYEVLARIRISFGFWAVQYCYMQFFHSLGAVFDVATHPTHVKAWRPFFGSARHAYTVRGFWGKFWHQAIRLILTSPAELITVSVFGLKSSLVSRYLKVFLTFAVSGAMHVVADGGGGVSMVESGAMRFFCTQALAIMLEDGVQELYRRMGGRKGSMLAKMVGYVWVLGFLSWSSPTWVYPIVRTMKREEHTLTPFALKPLVEYFWS